MATTPNYSWVMPDPTDYVTDLPADFEIFGDAVDASLKTVEDLANAQIPKSLVDAKGDLIAATADNTPARLAVGTNGQVLTANSSATAGVEWATPATSAPPVLTPNVSTLYIRSFGEFSEVGTASGNTDRTDYTPVYLPTCTLDRLAVICDSFTTAGNVRLGIYNNGADNRPGSLLLDAGTVNITATGTFQVTISQAVTAGWYWLAANGQSGTYDLVCYRTNTGARANPYLSNFETAPSINVSTTWGYRQASVTGAFPNPASSLTAQSQPIMTWARIA
jgi:hypothetical protein